MIVEVDTEGNSVSLTNKGEEDISVANWILKSTAGDREVSFKFHSRQGIKAGKTVTVSFGYGKTNFVKQNDKAKLEYIFRCGPTTRVKSTNRRAIS